MKISVNFKVVWDSLAEPASHVEENGQRLKSCIHSGNAGDIVYSLPTVRELGTNHYVINLCSDPGFRGRNIDFSTARALVPLLLAQPYIQRVTIVSNNLPLEYLDGPIGGIDYNLDKFRLQDVDKHHLAISHATAFGLRINLYEKWLHVGKDESDSDYTVVSLTTRYRSLPKEYWPEVLSGLDNIMVIGLPQEFHCVSGITADFVTCADFLEMARIIQGCRLFIGNPSLAYAIAEGLKVTRVVELHSEFQNAYPIGRSGYVAPSSIVEARNLVHRLISDSSENALGYQNTTLCRKIVELEAAVRNKDADIGNLEKEVRQRDTVIQEQAQHIQDKDVHIENIEKHIQAKDTHIQSIEKHIRDKDVHIESIEKQIQAKDTHIENIEKHIRDKDVHIESIEKQIQAKDVHIESIEKQIQAKDTHIKNKDAHIQNIEKRIQYKDTHIGNLVEQIDHVQKELQAKDGVIQEQAQHIQAKDGVIQEQAQHIEAKDTHIQNIESELSLIKQSKVWRMAEFLRRLFYIKLLGKFPLLQKGILTISREGFGQFFAKTKRYLISNKNNKTLEIIQSDYDKWIEKNEPKEKELEEQRSKKFHYEPKISIIVPVFNTPKQFLIDMIESVLNQTYSNWELCMADGASKGPHVKEVIEYYTKGDSRIRLKFLDENEGIAGNSNEALSLATGDFIGLLDHDDILPLFALYEVVKTLNENPKADFIYSDEDKISEKGDKRFYPHFKPDWSPDTLRSCNYITHFAVIRKKILDEVGGFREGYEGSQDYDLILRVIERTQRIEHIPKVLYHWRSHTSSAAHGENIKIYAYDSAKKALNDHINRMGLHGEVYDGPFLGSYRIKYHIDVSPMVSIIIPTKDKVDVLKRCITSILQKSSYRHYRILIVDNQSVEAETFKYYKELKNESKIKILSYDKTFNFSAINNYAVSQIDSEYIIFLNNDTEIISCDWIEAMLEFAQRKDVGAVGAKLYYPNDTIQHAGVILGLGGVACHSHKDFLRNDVGYMGRAKIIQNLSAVTAACLMTKKEVFYKVNGFNENYSHAFNDVDFCLNIRKSGYLIIYTPYVELYHHESLSRGVEDTEEKKIRFKNEIDNFQRKWGDVLAKGDPYYNLNLTLDREDFSIRI